MSVIIISCDNFEQGSVIAQNLADSLDYRLVDRGLLDQAAETCQVERTELLRTLQKTPPLFLMRLRYRLRLACIEAACLDELLVESAVCHGLAAEMYVRGVSHVLKVRVNSDKEQLANSLAHANGISLEQARKMIQQQKDVAQQWSLRNYQVDPDDFSHFDYVINLERVEPDKAVEQISDLSYDRRFQPMTYSRMCMQDLALASQIRLRLLKRFPEIKVEAEDGTVAVYTQALKKDQRKKQDMMRQMAGDIPGLRRLELHSAKNHPGRAAQTTP